MGVFLLEVKRDLSLVLEGSSLVVLSCVLSSWEIASHVYSQANLNFTFSPLSEMHKQTWHLPLSKQRLMLHYYQSVNLVLNVCLKYDGWCLDHIKRRSLPKPEILHIQRQKAWCSRQPTPCCLMLTSSRIWLLLSGRDVFFLGERHIWPWIISP